MSLQLRDSFVTLASTRLDTLVAFYDRLFSQPPSTLVPGKYAEYRLPGLRLALFHPSDRHRAEFADAAASPMSLCLEVADLDAAVAHLGEMGYPPPGDILHTSHGREVYAYDPDGNRAILHQRP